MTSTAPAPTAALATTPALAEPAVAVEQDDPAFAVVARARAAQAALEAALDGELEPDDDNSGFPEAEADDEAYVALISTMPTTLAGLAAILTFVADASGDAPYTRSDEDTIAFFQVLKRSAARLTAEV